MQSNRKIDLGVQLYSLRALLEKDIAGTLALVRNMHMTDVEVPGFYGKTAAGFRHELDKHGLKASGVNFLWERFDGDIVGAIKDANALGAEYVIEPWIPHDGDFAIDHAKTAIAKFSEWGKQCSGAGLKFIYHPHGYEFRPHGSGTLFDIMVSQTSPENVNFELDIFWAFDGGVDPVALMQKYPSRFPLIHLKDVGKEVRPPNYTGHESVESDVALGAGQLDIPAILARAAKIGVKHYYIEDESCRALEQIPRSIEYVRSLGY